MQYNDNMNSCSDISYACQYIQKQDIAAISCNEMCLCLSVCVCVRGGGGSAN